MTAMAQPLSGLDASHTDAMDLLSDTGYDGGDGDIEIDIGPMEGDDVQAVDDAISLQDAATEGDVELQTYSADADDYMVDKDDLIEEDEEDIVYADVELEDADHSAGNSQIDVSQQAETELNPNNDENIEEDLIDYSDDEDGQQAEIVSTVGSDAQGAQKGDSSAETMIEAENPEHAPLNSTAAVLDDENDGLDQHDGDGEQGDASQAAQPFVQDDSAHWEQKDGMPFEQFPLAEGGHEHVSSPEVETAEDEAPRASALLSESNVQHESHRDDREEEQRNSPAGQDSVLHPVTVNYDGTELWLFKTEDSEDGEWLLADESLATQPFPYLFSACRAQLGDDVSNETELGIRFDNFHGLELFEDCTACAYSTLKEFIDIYTTLHAQDGQTEPEPLYVTLQFRPRVLSLVNELKKAVQDRIGFTGLNNAIAAGRTNFTNAFGQHLDDFQDQWHGEDEEDDDEPQDVEGAEKDGEDTGDATVPHPDGSGHDVEDVQAHEHTADGSPTASLAEGDAAEYADQVAVAEPTSTVVDDPAGDRSEEAPASASQTGDDAQEDFIDYSDDEGEDDAGEAGHSPTQAISSVSSTLQGDDPSDSQYAVQESTNEDKRHDGDREPDTDHHVHDNTDRSAQTAVGFEEEEGTHSQYESNLALDNPEDATANAPDFDLGDYSGQTLGQEDNGDEEYYEGEYTEVDQQNDQNLRNEAEYADESGAYDDDAVVNEGDYEGDGHYVELVDGEQSDDAPSSGMPENEIEDEIYYDEEDAPEADAVAESVPQPPPSAASSVGLDNTGSPQGQKRSHDEVDDDLDGVSDTDSKRTKL